LRSSHFEKGEDQQEEPLGIGRRRTMDVGDLAMPNVFSGTFEGD